jgi:DNA adenine methylase
MAATASKWRGRLSLLETWHDRLSRVQLDNRCALQSLKYWDGAETLHYVDPPYAAETRAKGSPRERTGTKPATITTSC